jgi:hypothetical protein
MADCSTDQVPTVVAGVAGRQETAGCSSVLLYKLQCPKAAHVALYTGSVFQATGFDDQDVLGLADNKQQ